METMGDDELTDPDPEDHRFAALDTLPLGSVIQVRLRYWGTVAFGLDPDDLATYRIVGRAPHPDYPRDAVLVEQLSGPPCDVDDGENGWGLSPVHAVATPDQTDLPYWVAFVLLSSPGEGAGDA